MNGSPMAATAGQKTATTHHQQQLYGDHSQRSANFQYFQQTTGGSRIPTGPSIGSLGGNYNNSTNNNNQATSTTMLMSAQQAQHPRRPTSFNPASTQSQNQTQASNTPSYNYLPDHHFPRAQFPPRSMNAQLCGLLENIKEKAHSAHFSGRSWTDLSKICAKLTADRRPPTSSLPGSQNGGFSSLLKLTNSDEKSSLQRCLDTIQKNVKIESIQSMAERLEALTRSLPGLKFTHTGHECFISSDMYYIEVTLEKNQGRVLDVKVAHHNDPVSCPELTRVLAEEKFGEFCLHLEGLSSIYSISGEKKSKTKAYIALSALESDLAQLADLQSSISDISNLIYKSPVGILERRKGGQPMKLKYFVSPYDLLDLRAADILPLSKEIITAQNLGHHVKVQIESSSPHKIQTSSLITISKSSDGKGYPSFGQLSNLNSSTLAARFVLQLSQPMPISLSTVKNIANLIKLPGFIQENSTSVQSLLHLVAHQAITGTKRSEPREDSKPSELSIHANSSSLLTGPFYVPLPDQLHCYHMEPPLNKLEGVLVDRVPFTHPTNVPQILGFLRAQALFNFILSSCMRKSGPLRRPTSTGSFPSLRPFDLTASNTNMISVTFEHPSNDSLASVDFDLKDITNLKCKIISASSSGNSSKTMCSDDVASKVFSKSWSIPITLRTIVRVCEEKNAQIARKNRAEAEDASRKSQISQSGSGQITDVLLQKLLEQQATDSNQNSGGNVRSMSGNASSSSRTSIDAVINQVSRGGGDLSSLGGSNMLMSMLSDTPSANKSTDQPSTKGRKSRKRTGSGADEFDSTEASMTPALKSKRRRAESVDSNKSDSNSQSWPSTEQLPVSDSYSSKLVGGAMSMLHSSDQLRLSPFATKTGVVQGKGGSLGPKKASTGSKPGPKPGQKAAKLLAAAAAAAHASEKVTKVTKCGQPASGAIKAVKQMIASGTIASASAALVAVSSAAAAANSSSTIASAPGSASSKISTGPGNTPKKAGSLNAVLARLHASSSTPTSSSSNTASSESCTNSVSGNSAAYSAPPSSSGPAGSLKSAEKLKYTVKSSGKGSSDLKITIKRPTSTTTTSSTSSTSAIPNATTSSISKISPELSHIFNKPQTTSKGFTIPKKKTLSPSLPNSSADQTASQSSISLSTSSASNSSQGVLVQQIKRPINKNFGPSPGNVYSSSGSGQSGVSGPTNRPGGPLQRPPPVTGAGGQIWTSQNAKSQLNTSPHYQRNLGAQSRPVGQASDYSPRTSPSYSSPRPFSTSPSTNSTQSIMQRNQPGAQPRSNPITPPLLDPRQRSSTPMDSNTMLETMTNYFAGRPPGITVQSTYINANSNRPAQVTVQQIPHANRTLPLSQPQSTPPQANTSSDRTAVQRQNSVSSVHSIPEIESPTGSPDAYSSQKSLPSSSTNKDTSSTPSSPAECVDATPSTQPTLIPTESIHEPPDAAEPENVGTSAAVEDDDPDQLILDIPSDVKSPDMVDSTAYNSGPNSEQPSESSATPINSEATSSMFENVASSTASSNESSAKNSAAQSPVSGNPSPAPTSSSRALSLNNSISSLFEGEQVTTSQRSGDHAANSNNSSRKSPVSMATSTNNNNGISYRTSDELPPGDTVSSSMSAQLSDTIKTSSTSGGSQPPVSSTSIKSSSSTSSSTDNQNGSVDSVSHLMDESEAERNRDRITSNNSDAIPIETGMEF